MKCFKLLIISLLYLFSIYCSAQESKTISGKIIDERTSRGLSFATVALKNSGMGTLTNENGEFAFLMQPAGDKDSLIISYLGYETKRIALNAITGPVTIRLAKNSFMLKEVLIRPLSPEEYIKLAINNIKDNYPSQPFQTLGYYRELALENKGAIRDQEAVFKTYYPSYQDSAAKNQHQIVLHRKGEVKPLQFMKDKIDKAIKKENKKAEKSGDETEIDPEELISNFGGPEAILGADFVHEREYFLDSTRFKQYDFSFDPPSSFLGKDILVINFESRRRVEYQYQWGKIFIEPETYAIVSVEFTSSLEIPGIAEGALFVLGLGIEETEFSVRYNYYPTGGKWYPQNFQADVSAVLIRKHIFKANEVSRFKIEQLFMINKIITDTPTPVEESKRFKSDKKFEEQVFNEGDLKWTDINTIKR